MQNLFFLTFDLLKYIIQYFSLLIHFMTYYFLLFFWVPQVVFVQGKKRERKEAGNGYWETVASSQSFDMSHGAKMRIAPKHSDDTKEGWVRDC